MRLKNKVAIITGGASGIGRETVKRFLEEDAIVVFTDINEEMGRMTLRRFQEKYDTVAFLVQDVQKEEDWIRVVEEVLDKYGKIDILFNNAGVYKKKAINEFTVEDFDFMMAINVKGVFLGMKHVINVMKRQRNGSIINTSSIAGLKSAPGHSFYGATKGAVNIMSKGAALDVISNNIRINTIHPGTIATEMVDNFVASQKTISIESFHNSTPMKRMGTPVEVANAVVFLASDESSFITGSELVIDGGTTATTQRT
ncbi:SDR family NAD(P)-dependent oxidoreductase [Neobacillus rhizophilus]|uniref:Glucose 1-dehydrogenase n=1 Tax=Neobacillus rhizophilus TaxID=2833579 RepID=A0A942YWK8_9BACI|nr:glucose 1-dehydrogenase [Neobacillus rhizophilus]MBS4215174.1 glucose 1-dehydrogenase [Neobacillus rhizophilus]